MSGINELKWQTLTAAINEMKSPNQFLKKFLFPVHNTVNTEDIELSTLVKDRTMAPLVRKNGEAVLVLGHDESYATISPPNIRIKRPFTPSELLFGRRPGTTIYPQVGEQLSAIQQHIARDMQVMADMVTNTEEYLCAMATQGVISYQVSDEESYQITYPVPSANKVTLSTFWDDGTPANVTLEENFMSAKKLMSDAVGLGITDAILGASATTYFLRVIKSQYNLATGVMWNPTSINLAAEYTDDGAIYLGTFCGVRVWSYPRTIVVNGVTTDLIRSKYCEFIANTSAAERVLYYGAIADMDALQGNLFVAERFSKSWLQKDPSSMIALLASRPLPAQRRPGSVVSFKVVSG